jgi:hypothetical protein
VEAADDEAVAGGVREGEGEALVAAGVLERIEPNEPNPLDRSAAVGLQDRRPSRQHIELGRDRVDLVEVGVEDGLEAAALRTAGDPVQSLADAAKPACLNEDDQEQEEDDDRQADDDRSDVRRDQGVEVDVTISGRRRTRWLRSAESSR